MSVEPSAAPEPLPAPQPTAWRELALYLVGGLALVLLANLVALWLAPGHGLAFSLAIYVSNAVALAGAAYFLGVRRLRLTWSEFGLRPFAWQWLVLALAGALAVLPLRLAAGFLAQVVLQRGAAEMQPRMDLLTPPGPPGLSFAITLIGTAVLAPIAEEFFFRGLVHRWFWAHFAGRPWLRAALSSIIFALGHLDSVAVVAASFPLGFINAVAYERSRSLWLPIAIHAANNALAVLLLYAVLAFQR